MCEALAACTHKVYCYTDDLEGGVQERTEENMLVLLYPFVLVHMV